MDSVLSKQRLQYLHTHSTGGSKLASALLKERAVMAAHLELQRLAGCLHLLSFCIGLLGLALGGGQRLCQLGGLPLQVPANASDNTSGHMYDMHFHG